MALQTCSFIKNKKKGYFIFDLFSTVLHIHVRITLFQRERKKNYGCVTSNNEVYANQN